MNASEEGAGSNGLPEFPSNLHYSAVLQYSGSGHQITQILCYSLFCFVVCFFFFSLIISSILTDFECEINSDLIFPGMFRACLER